MKDSKRAFYLIDDARFYIAGIATSWDYDNRVCSDKNDVFPNTLHDRHSGTGLRFKRDIQVQTEGGFRLEMLLAIGLCADGVCIQVTSSEDRPLFEIKTCEGVYVFNGEKTAEPSTIGEMRLRVDFNLETRNAIFAVNGHTVGYYPLYHVTELARVYIGTTGETEITVTPQKIQLCANYLVHETFLGTSSDFPETVALNGCFEMRRHDGANLQMNYTYAVASSNGKNACQAIVPFEDTKEDILAEVYLLSADGADGVRVSLLDTDEEVFGVYTKNSAFYAWDGSLLRPFTPNVWQVVRFETDGTQVNIKLDGKLCGTLPFEPHILNGIQVYFSPDHASELCFTDIRCERRYEPDDYCPEPKNVRHPEYEIGINVCNMWREGHHFGWDRITYFKDNLPLIGPYDEGVPEVADWEIKFMTEHGITFEHFCWYCPDPVINFPIKRSRMDHALRDGFMNARYSDKMKFMIMWENNGYQNTNPEDFKEYVWKYWCEYFFTDPRYLKIDNKPVVSLWSFRFVEHWGGKEKAKEIIAFMNEDIRKYGCDGILLLATAGMSQYENLSEYCDATYSYHFGTEGYKPEHQLECIDSLNAKVENGLVPYIQTVSVGFNACPWHGADARVPLIQPEDYEKVLRYTKDHSDRITDKKWYHKLFMMSTWNEYGEGTYIMPSNLHGFAYLDKLRAVFVPDSGKAENLLPNENQSRRITTLRAPHRVILRRLGYQTSDRFRAPNTTVRIDAFATEQPWQSYHDTVNVLYTGTSIELSANATHDHYSLVLWGGEEGLFDADTISHIRVYVRAHGKPAALRFAYLTDTDKRWAGNKCEKIYSVPVTENFVPIDFHPGRFPTWRGRITDIRIDNMNAGTWELEKLEYLVYKNPQGTEPAVYVGGERISFAFEPIPSDGDLVVSIDPTEGLLRALKLYHEYDETAHTFFVASTTIQAVFSEASAIVRVNGHTRALTEPMRMRDGLPTLKLGELCDIFGYRYTFSNDRMDIEV